jgi:hypothetical protein
VFTFLKYQKLTERRKKVRKTFLVFLCAMAFFLCTTTMASALSFHDSATGTDWINTNSSGPDTRYTYNLDLPSWYDSDLATKFDLTLTGHGDNSRKAIDFYVSVDDKSSWTMVGSYNAPRGVSFTETLDILGYKGLFDGHDNFDVAYGCHYWHDMTEVNIEQNPVPEPTTLILLGSGLVGLAGFGRKKFKK